MTTYATLKTNVAAWINRTDLTSVIPTFVSLAADRIYLGSKLTMQDGAILENEPLRIGDMLTTVNPFTGTLPTDWVEVKRVAWVVSGSGTSQLKQPINFMPLTKMTQYEGVAGTPAYFSLKGDTVIYGPTFTNDVELIYYARPAALTLDADVLPSGLDASYLYGTLLEAAMYLKDDEAIRRYGLAFIAAVQAIQDQDEGDSHSGGLLRVRSDTRQ